MNPKINPIAKALCECTYNHDYEVCGNCLGEEDNYIGCQNMAENLSSNYNVYKSLTCSNLSDSFDEFKCSNCHIYLANFCSIDIDQETEEMFDCDYQLKYCPNCGAKVID